MSIINATVWYCFNGLSVIAQRSQMQTPKERHSVTQERRSRVTQDRRTRGSELLDLIALELQLELPAARTAVRIV